MSNRRDEAVEYARRFLNGPVIVNDVKATAAETSADLNAIAAELKRAAEDPDTNDFDVLLALAADGLYRAERLPKWLATFAADVLSGKRKRPTKRGADKYGNWERDYKLWRATQEVALAFDLQCYSNNELSSQTTAAEIVSHAAGCSADVVITAYKKFSRAMGAK